jgi:hypothetical protein
MMANAKDLDKPRRRKIAQIAENTLDIPPYTEPAQNEWESELRDGEILGLVCPGCQHKNTWSDLNIYWRNIFTDESLESTHPNRSIQPQVHSAASNQAKQSHNYLVNQI